MLGGNEHVLEVRSLRALVQKSSVGDFQAAGGDDQSSGTRSQLRAGRIFQYTLRSVEPNFNRPVTDFLVDLDMPCGFGGWESA